MAFDVGELSEEALDHSSRIDPLFDRAGKPYPDAWIEVVSIDSSRYRDAQRKTNQKRLDRTLRSGRPNLSAAEMEDEALAMLAACTVRWGGFVKEGAELPCTPDNVRWLYTVAPWIREQVSNFMGDRQNFSSASANGSRKQ